MMSLALHTLGDRITHTEGQTGTVTAHRIDADGSAHYYRVLFDGAAHDSDWIREDMLFDGEQVSSLDTGDAISVTWGAEKYAPRQYMNFDVGPISATTHLRQGESAEEAHERVWKWLEAQARKEFIAKRNQFLINLQEL